MSETAAKPDVAIRSGPARFHVDDASPEVHDLLYDSLAWKDPDARFIDAYQEGHWDGMRHLYGRGSCSAPIGLLDRARDALEAEGYTVTVTDDRESAGEPISTAWNFPHDLRDYQHEAVAPVLDTGGGVLAIPTGGGKTIVALRVIHDLGRRAIVFVHSQQLLYQWSDRVEDVLGVEPGTIGDGEWDEGPITVASMQTLTERDTDDLEEYDVAIFDECHKTSAADTFHDAGQAVDAPLRIGLSATPWRSVDGEELKIEGAVGGEAYHVPPAELIDAGYLARPEWRVVDSAEHGEQFTADPGEEYDDAERRCIAECPARNRAIAETATDLASDGRSVLVSVDRLGHGERLTALLTDAYDAAATFLQGSDDTDRRDTVLDGFGPGDVLVSTLLREGVDLPELDAIVLASGGKSEVEIIQRIGRALRPEGQEPAVIVDVRDRGEHFGDHFEERRRICREYYGEHGPAPATQEETIRKWLESEGLPPAEFTIYEDPADGRFWIDKTGYLTDPQFNCFTSVMRDTEAVGYDGNSNYVEKPGELPEVSIDE